MKSHAKVVVIGGGVVGVSALYHLAKKGWGDDVDLIEKAELTSGSTWHAAGLLPLFNMSYSVGQVHKYSVNLYRELEEETGITAADIRIDEDFRYETRYLVKGGRYKSDQQYVEKTLRIYLATLVNDVTLEITEHQGYQWFRWQPPWTMTTSVMTDRPRSR